MMSQKYKFSIPKILENIMYSPKLVQSQSSMDFFAQFRGSEVHEVSDTSVDRSFDMEILQDHKLRQTKILIMNQMQALQQELHIISKLESRLQKIELNIEILNINQQQFQICKQE
ncbi:Hypothetical_protein [Hexamita inflata]|uniref:Hypothetical_protein n=1 Tax=Hexamita inflata TaxID=28002 RepID=A0AA86UYF8_9EUKA|nr:Hypothetical protein HINF_LOCUS40398 [Hexamita inflata]